MVRKVSELSVHVVDLHLVVSWRSAVRALSNAAVVVAADGDAPLIAALLVLLREHTAASAPLLLLDAVDDAHRPTPQCHRVSEEARHTLDYKHARWGSAWVTLVGGAAE